MAPPDLTRREFVNLSVGYALAVSPITAHALTTPSGDLETGEAMISVGDKKSMPAYFAHPKKKGSYPVVIVIHEIFGVHEYIRDVCRRLAKEGFYAVAPYLYFRHGDATKIADMTKLRTEIVGKVDQKTVWSDLDETTTWLGKQKSADASRVGLTGFCWGGSFVWTYAARNLKVKAGVAWYGRFVGEVSPLVAQYPLDIGATLTVPVLGLYGEKDKGIPLDTIEKMRGELKKGKTKSEIIVFAGAEHGFHADYRPSYHEASAKEAWQKLLSWFKTHGLGA